MVEKHQRTLEPVLARLGDKSNPAAVPEVLCVELRSRLVSIFQMSESAVNPGPGGLFSGLVRALTEAAQDPDVHVHKWLREEHQVKADKILQAEGRKGYVQLAANREELVRQVAPLQLAKITVIIKGEKVRLIHDMRRNGTNSKVQLEERRFSRCVQTASRDGI